MRAIGLDCKLTVFNEPDEPVENEPCGSEALFSDRLVSSKGDSWDVIEIRHLTLHPDQGSFHSLKTCSVESVKVTILNLISSWRFLSFFKPSNSSLKKKLLLETRACFCHTQHKSLTCTEGHSVLGLGVMVNKDSLAALRVSQP